MLATAVALNLEASKSAVEKGVGSKNPAIQAMLGGQDPRHYLSSGGAAMPVSSQQQWLAVLEELGGPKALPIPNSFPQGVEKGEFSYAFISTGVDGVAPPEGRWSQGPSIDGRGEFHLERARPLGEEPVLSSPADISFAQNEQMQGGPGASPQTGSR